MNEQLIAHGLIILASGENFNSIGPLDSSKWHPCGNLQTGLSNTNQKGDRIKILHKIPIFVSGL